jgi:hypothetical protein
MNDLSIIDKLTYQLVTVTIRGEVKIYTNLEGRQAPTLTELCQSSSSWRTENYPLSGTAEFGVCIDALLSYLVPDDRPFRLIDVNTGEYHLVSLIDAVTEIPGYNLFDYVKYLLEFNPPTPPRSIPVFDRLIKFSDGVYYTGDEHDLTLTLDERNYSTIRLYGSLVAVVVDNYTYTPDLKTKVYGYDCTGEDYNDWLLDFSLNNKNVPAKLTKLGVGFRVTKDIPSNHITDVKTILDKELDNLRLVNDLLN